ncbi:MAG: hypothetical protein JWM11_3638 [Planctomycetaceae bacterium]|nr:hypothetical protein [Planctomycetaceae bacterium]
MPGFDVFRPTLGVLFGRDFIFTRRQALLGLFEILFQIGNTPAAAGSRAATFADLAGAPGAVKPDVIHDFAF